MKASEIRELLKLLEQPDIISFAGGIPDPALFPAEEFKAAYADIFSGSQVNSALQYSVSEGYKPLRDWIVEDVAKIGIECSADNVFITSGSQQALDYLGKLFLSPKDTALVTWPTYLGALSAFNAYEPNYDQLSLNGNRTPDAYRDTASKLGGSVKFAYLSADFSNPTGETIDRAGREKLLALADELDIAILGAMSVIRKLVLMKQAADLHSSTINQIAVEHVASRGFAEQVAKIKRVYSGRRDAMLAALAKYMPKGTTWTKPEGGMFVWITLPEGMDGAELLAKSLATEKVAFVPGKAFYADGSNANTLRVSFSCANDEMIDEGIKRLGRLVANASVSEHESLPII